MSYVEKNYSENYVEGDSLPANTTPCDLSPIVALIEAQNIQIAELKSIVSSLSSAIQTNKTLGLSTHDLLTDTALTVNSIKTDISNLDLSVDLSSLATKDFILSKIPFVDDMNAKIFPKGTLVNCIDVDGIGTVVSSHLLPTSTFDYVVIYTIEYEILGVPAFSNFPAPQVVKYVAPVA